MQLNDRLLKNFNKNYYCKVCTPFDRKGRLLGRHGFISLVGREMAVKLLLRAEKSKLDKITCRLRRGLVFTFYVK